MEVKQFPYEGYRINEYLLVLPLPEDLHHKILAIKEEFSEKYKTSHSRFMKPHITLVNFLGLDMIEEKLIHRLQTIAMGINPFKIELRDYGSFPSHTLFVNVVSKLPILDLVKQIKIAQGLMKLSKDNKPHFIDEPHIVIVQKLKPWQYEQSWLEYSHRHFTGRFITDGMLLLKRPAGSKSSFQIMKRMEFLNLPGRSAIVNLEFPGMEKW
ncbi:MAG: 2'-5' RNA ligase family protein [Flavisolibacter sp.]